MQENLAADKSVIQYQFNNYNRLMYSITILVCVLLMIITFYLVSPDEAWKAIFQLGAGVFPGIIGYVLVNKYPSLLFFSDSIKIFWIGRLMPKYVKINYQSIERIIKNPKHDTYYLITRLTDNNLKFYRLRLWFFPQKNRKYILTILQLKTKLIPEISYEYRMFNKFNVWKDRAAFISQ